MFSWRLVSKLNMILQNVIEFRRARHSHTCTCADDKMMLCASVGPTIPKWDTVMNVVNLPSLSLFSLLFSEVLIGFVVFVTSRCSKVQCIDPQFLQILSIEH